MYSRIPKTVEDSSAIYIHETYDIVNYEVSARSLPYRQSSIAIDLFIISICFFLFSTLNLEAKNFMHRRKSQDRARGFGEICKTTTRSYVTRVQLAISWQNRQAQFVRAFGRRMGGGLGAGVAQRIKLNFNQA